MLERVRRSDAEISQELEATQCLGFIRTPVRLSEQIQSFGQEASVPDETSGATE